MIEDVGDLANSDRALAHVAEPLVNRELFLFVDAQGLIEVAAGYENVGDLAHGDRARVHVAEALVDWDFFLFADAQGLIELAASIEDASDLALSNRRHSLGPFDFVRCERFPCELLVCRQRLAGLHFCPFHLAGLNESLRMAQIKVGPRQDSVNVIGCTGAYRCR